MVRTRPHTHQKSHKPPTPGGMTPQQRLQNQLAGGNNPTPPGSPRKQGSHRQQGNPPKPPQQNTAPLVQQWKDAFKKAGGVAKQAVTPHGIATGAKVVGGAAVKGVKVAADQTYKGMQWVEKKRDESMIRERERNARRMQNWQNLDADTRRELIEEQAQKAAATEKIRSMRRGFEDFQLDKQEAMLTGQRFQPKVFKITNPITDEEKIVDEYGRELPGMPVEQQFKRQSRGGYGSGYGQGYGSGGGQSPINQRSEVSDIEDLFGANYVNKRQPQRQVQEAPPQQSYQSEQPQMMGSGGMEEVRRRKHRGEPSPQQYQQPQLQAPPQQKRRRFNEDEFDELNMLRGNEQESLKQLFGY